jgi:drug/metabolite transporter (DMT)-like permease
MPPIVAGPGWTGPTAARTLLGEPRSLSTHTMPHLAPPPGAGAALGAALLFGAATPLAKLLLGAMDPWLLAGLLYLGSGVGLTLYRLLRRAPPVHLAPGEWAWLAGAILAGGVAAPVILMVGLASMPASGAALLLNAESLFTALLAWLLFGENVSRRAALGLAAIASGALVLTWPGEARFGSPLSALLVLGACAAWGLDNNLTRRVALADATWIAALKGLVAGLINLLLSWALNSSWPGPATVAAALVLGFLAYGVSLALFVVGLRHLGAARSGAYFAVAPFGGAALALALGERPTLALAISGGLMAFGVWLHLTERHSHLHAHSVQDHDHLHRHDAHHQHEHDPPLPPGASHRHPHHHPPLSHTHPHAPDAHHRHSHDH